MFNNTYSQLPDHFYERIAPASFTAPKLIKFNRDLALELGFDLNGVSDSDLAQVFSGQKILEGSEPLAMAYAGFQFGHKVPQLGDGRAHLLGEANGFDVQLKGSGQTRFSRRGDGRSALGPVLREYIVSEAMHALGVPTTRALCAVETGEEVYRQFGPEPGAIFTRVASSHIRVGTFQYFAFRQDIEAVRTLLNYTISRHYPDLLDISDEREKVMALLTSFTEKQSDLVASWMTYGFIHGVMNTDNFSLAGITIDYGPCAFMDEFKFHKVFSSIDRHSRYSFFNQPQIAKWNILRLADCLLPLIDSDLDTAIKVVEDELISKFDVFELKVNTALAKKFGIDDYSHTTNDETLIMDFLKYLEQNALDFTLAFRDLANLYNDIPRYLEESGELNSLKERLLKRVGPKAQLEKINPIYIPRNHQVEKAIDDAYKGDFTHFEKLINVLSDPFTEHCEFSDFALAPTKDQRVYQTFCGT
jgi:uncharacterized protein YdiU (UPF0061 family)